jgi:hypothetical protein
MAITTKICNGLEPGFSKLELMTARGPVYRLISAASPRDATLEEIPVIDIAGIYGDLKARQKLAGEIREACQGYGFFYIKNHGIDEKIINNAQEKAWQFFRQPQEVKENVSDKHSKFSNGWSALRSRRVSPTESAGEFDNQDCCLTKVRRPK